MRSLSRDLVEKAEYEWHDPTQPRDVFEKLFV